MAWSLISYKNNRKECENIPVEEGLETKEPNTENIANEPEEDKSVE